MKPTGQTRNTYSHPQIRRTGASSLSKHLFCTVAAISPPTPPVVPASCITAHRPVFLTLSITVSTSQGKMVRRSISSTEAPLRDLGMRDSSDGGGEDRIESAL